MISRPRVSEVAQPRRRAGAARARFGLGWYFGCFAGGISTWPGSRAPVRCQADHQGYLGSPCLARFPLDHRQDRGGQPAHVRIPPDSFRIAPRTRRGQHSGGTGSFDPTRTQGLNRLSLGWSIEFDLLGSLKATVQHGRRTRSTPPRCHLSSRRCRLFASYGRG